MLKYKICNIYICHLLYLLPFIIDRMNCDFRTIILGIIKSIIVDTIVDQNHACWEVAGFSKDCHATCNEMDEEIIKTCFVSVKYVFALWRSSIRRAIVSILLMREKMEEYLNRNPHPHNFTWFSVHNHNLYLEVFREYLDLNCSSPGIFALDPTTVVGVGSSKICFTVLLLVRTDHVGNHFPVMESRWLSPTSISSSCASCLPHKCTVLTPTRDPRIRSFDRL